MEEISQVSLSTTLATNAIVEGRGARVGLIYMGAELEDKVPAELEVKVKGRFDIMGRLREELDQDEIRNALLQMKGRVEAIAVSGYASVRNPKHEKEVGRMAQELLDVPVVCAHQLTSALGFHHRTVTAVLNGRLIPIIRQLLRSTKEVLREKNIHAQLLVVKGDGTLMTEAVAKERPIETILSGPAASVIGSLALTGRKEGIVLDMGGTTTDIAHVSDGTVKIKKEGAKVGGWFTRVQAAEMCTFGLGGDSRIYLDEKGRLQIGPQKVWPLCLIGAEYPHLVRELKSFTRVGEYKRYFAQEADCFLLGSNPLPAGASEWEQRIADMLRERPHSLTYLAGQLGVDAETLELTPLVESGVLSRISVTPTDLLHAQGTYTRWNRDAALAGIRILAKRKEMPISKFLSAAEEAVNEKMAMCCLQSAAAGQITETVELLISEDGGQYILSAPWRRMVCGSREEAVFYAIHEGRKHIEHLLWDAGCRTWTIRETSSDILADVAAEDGTAQTACMGTKLVVSGTGSPL